MSEYRMKSIDKLREWSCHTDLHEIADEIEAEITANYLELPKDADDVPIHVGDICEMNDEQFEVRQLTTDGNCWWAVDRLGEFYIADLCHYAKPRTLEDVLMDAGVSRAAINDVADEIRELLRGDA